MILPTDYLSEYVYENTQAVYYEGKVGLKYRELMYRYVYNYYMIESFRFNLKGATKEQNFYVKELGKAIQEFSDFRLKIFNDDSVPPLDGLLSEKGFNESLYFYNRLYGYIDKGRNYCNRGDYEEFLVTKLLYHMYLHYNPEMPKLKPRMDMKNKQIIAE